MIGRLLEDFLKDSLLQYRRIARNDGQRKTPLPIQRLQRILYQFYGLFVAKPV